MLTFLLSGNSLANTLPKDFRVLAKFGSGSIVAQGDDVIAWNAAIDNSGKAYVDAISYPKGARHVRRQTKALSSVALQRLLRVINTAEFFKLPREMLGQVNDSPTYILTITADRRTHSVRVYAPFDVHDKQALRRFRVIWSAVFRYLPSPDRGEALHHLQVNS